MDYAIVRIDGIEKEIMCKTCNLHLTKNCYGLCEPKNDRMTSIVSKIIESRIVGVAKVEGNQVDVGKYELKGDVE